MGLFYSYLPLMVTEHIGPHIRSKTVLPNILSAESSRTWLTHSRHSTNAGCGKVRRDSRLRKQHKPGEKQHLQGMAGRQSDQLFVVSTAVSAFCCLRLPFEQESRSPHSRSAIVHLVISLPSLSRTRDKKAQVSDCGLKIQGPLFLVIIILLLSTSYVLWAT